MSTARHPAFERSPAVKWSLAAGLSLFVFGATVELALSDILGLFGDVTGLPVGYTVGMLASPSLVIGAVLWWTIIERRGAYAYRLGVAVGLLTALGTGLLWVVRFITVWGLEMLAIEIVALLAGFVLVVSVVVGALTGLPLMYARRRLADGQSPP